MKGAQIMLDDTGRAGAEAIQTDAIRRDVVSPVAPPDALRGTEALEGAQALPVRLHSTPRNERWYCVQHEPFNGHRARINIIRAGFPLCGVHWPRIIIRPRRGSDVIEELFPGYLFVRFDVRRPGWSLISRKGGHLLGILGVRELGAPIPVPAGEIERLVDRSGGIAGAIDGTGDAERERLAAEAAADDAQRASLAVGRRPRVECRQETFLDRELFGNRSLLITDRGKARVEVMMTWFGAERVAAVRRERLGRSAS